MRVLFTVSSWPTHYSTLVPIAWALQADGHEVRVLCTPTQVVPLSGAGLTPVPLLDSPEDDVRLRLQYYVEALEGLWPYPWPPLHPLTGATMSNLDEFDHDEFRERLLPEYAARAAASFDSAVDFARAYRPDLILHDPASIEGVLVGQLLGIPAIMSMWGPVGTAEPEHMRIMPEDISDSFPRYGLDPFTADMITTVIDACPPSLTVPMAVRRLPVRYVPYNGNGAAPRWVLDPAERPRVCVTWSTALASMSGPRASILPELVRGLLDLDVELVVTAMARDLAALGPLPRSVRVVERLPLRLVLPSSAAVIHHGGGGSTLTSLWAGVPQLAPTFASEQTASARRVQAAGAGLHMLGHLATAATVRESVEKLLADGSYAASASALREEMHALPTPAELVRSLPDLVADPG